MRTLIPIACGLAAIVGGCCSHISAASLTIDLGKAEGVTLVGAPKPLGQRRQSAAGGRSQGEDRRPDG